jgi:hypothetical protein
MYSLRHFFIHESIQFPSYARNLAVSNNIIPSPAKAAILRAAAMSGVIRARSECRASSPDGSLGAKTSVADWPAEAWKADTTEPSVKVQPGSHCCQWPSGGVRDSISSRLV